MHVLVDAKVLRMDAQTPVLCCGARRVGQCQGIEDGEADFSDFGFVVLVAFDVETY